ncbi:erythromycin esterase family protein [Marinobacter vulgaris]|uniref:erythromycin esterase family protein n=1 Tax=Marinobacter vulgaris TaxID=1928331 RepID=UPI003CC75CC0
MVAQLVELRRKAPDYVRQDGISSASSWGGKVEHKAVRKALPESYEYLFHQTGEAAFFLSGAW